MNPSLLWSFDIVIVNAGYNYTMLPNDLFIYFDILLHKNQTMK